MKLLPELKRSVEAMNSGSYPVKILSNDIKTIIAVLESASTDGEGFVRGLEAAAKLICKDCADTDYRPEYQADPEPAFWHGNKKCRANEIHLATLSPAPASKGVSEDERPCTCHPDDNPPKPCPQKYALSECRATAITEGKT